MTGQTWSCQSRDFNPRSPRGERLTDFGEDVDNCPNFNPRSPRGERPALESKIEGYKKFQSTLPARGATYMGFAQTKQEQISIHAPREGSDCVSIHIILTRSDFNPRSPRGERLTQAAFGAESLSHFNPRSPRGERRSAILSPFASPRFQSTLPARGATCKISNGEQAAEISIHAPREGSDQLPCRMAQASRDFNPRSPRGERRTIAHATDPTRNFNPLSPRGERP